MDVSYGHLIDCCVRLLDGFDCKSVAAEHHVSDFFAHQKENLDDVEKTFITEVFSGCVRYGSVLDVIVDGYYRSDGRYVRNAEQSLHKVFAYLILFRLDELGIDNFKKFVKSQDVHKMHRFLNFTFNEKHILTWMKDEWNKLYDEEFVRHSLLQPLLRWLPSLLQMLEKLKLRCENGTPMKKSSLPTTEPRPFSLTTPKAKKIPMPERIPTVGKPKPVPKTTYQPPSDQQVIDRMKTENRMKAKELHDWMQTNSPSYTHSGKSVKTLQRMQGLVDNENSKLCFDGGVPNKGTSAPVVVESVPIKLNAAAILREEMLYRRREEEELKKLARLEAGEGDITEFEEWQARMRKKDLEKQLEEIEMRRLSGLLSQEEAIIAKQKLIQQNKETVTDMKAQAQFLMNEYMLQQLIRQEQMKKLMEKVVDSHENAKEAKRKIQAYKSKIVQAMNEETRDLMRRALEEAENEMRQKMELIQEIRAMEATSAARQPKTVDLTETAGYGLLCEMSIAELRERIGLLQAAEQEQEAVKRSQIINDKQAKTQMLLDKMDTISKHRVELSKAAAVRAEERRKVQKEKIQPSKPVLRSTAVLEMEQTLAERRAARLLLEQQKISGSQRQRSAHLAVTSCPPTAVKSRTALLAS